MFHQRLSPHHLSTQFFPKQSLSVGVLTILVKDPVIVPPIRQWCRHLKTLQKSMLFEGFGLVTSQNVSKTNGFQPPDGVHDRLHPIKPMVFEGFEGCIILQTGSIIPQTEFLCRGSGGQNNPNGCCAELARSKNRCFHEGS